MTGVGFSRHPDQDATDDNQIHLWKSDGRDSSTTYCGKFDIDIPLSNKGMTQVTQSQIENWKDNENVCDSCVDTLDEQYSG